MGGVWGMSPGESVAAECARRGEAAVVDGCVGLLEGRGADDDLVIALGGPAAQLVLGGRAGGRTGYWPRVWATRGLLYAWCADERAAPAVVAATGDPAWRVREMAFKVVIRRCLDDALEAATRADADPVRRVRVAEARAIVALTNAGS
jgi:hypothetical protein